MGEITKGIIEEMNKVATFIIGEPTDETMGMKAELTKEPMYGIPPWGSGAKVKYQHFWKDLLTGFNEVTTILWVFRVNKGSYDHPKFFHINKYGIRELVATKSKKEITQVIDAKDEYGRPTQKGRTLTNDGWMIDWSIIKFIPFDCQYCGHTVEECIKGKICEGEGLCRDCGLKFEGENPCKCLDKKARGEQVDTGTEAGQDNN